MNFNKNTHLYKHLQNQDTACFPRPPPRPRHQGSASSLQIGFALPRMSLKRNRVGPSPPRLGFCLSSLSLRVALVDVSLVCWISLPVLHVCSFVHQVMGLPALSCQEPLWMEPLRTFVHKSWGEHVFISLECLGCVVNAGLIS